MYNTQSVLWKIRKCTFVDIVLSVWDGATRKPGCSIHMTQVWHLPFHSHFLQIDFFIFQISKQKWWTVQSHTLSLDFSQIRWAILRTCHGKKLWWLWLNWDEVEMDEVEVDKVDLVEADGRSWRLIGPVLWDAGGGNQWPPDFLPATLNLWVRSSGQTVGWIILTQARLDSGKQDHLWTEVALWNYKAGCYNAKGKQLLFGIFFCFFFFNQCIDKI